MITLINLMLLSIIKIALPLKCESVNDFTVLVMIDTQEGSIWSTVPKCDQIFLIDHTGGIFRAMGTVL